MTTIRVFGDGVAGTMVALALHRAGATVVHHGDGATVSAQAHALVHRHAGRSFRTSSLEDDAWSVAVPTLRGLVARGVALELDMVRPAQERLVSSVAEAATPASIERAAIEPFGDCFRYGPAFAVDIGQALAALQAELDAAGVSRAGAGDPREFDGLRIVAVGQALDEYVDGLELQLQGGHLLTFEGALDFAVSAKGIHAVPTVDGGACVGSTWWDPLEPMSDGDAEAELRARAEDAGISLHGLRSVWRGIRCIHAPDRQPVVGAVSSGLYVVGALGTRGWLWAPYLAERLAEHLVHEVPLPEAVRISRTAARLRG